MSETTSKTDPQITNYVFFMHVKTTTTWLALPPKERFGFLEEVIRPMLARHPKLSMRFFDSEGFSADVTDVLMWEAPDVMTYQAIVEELRESKFWGTYFDVVQIVAGVENAYAIHYGVNAY
jgi:chlorite dismutase